MDDRAFQDFVESQVPGALQVHLARLDPQALLGLRDIPGYLERAAAESPTSDGANERVPLRQELN